MSDSDDDELPSVLNDCYSAEKQFKTDNVVWAKYRKFYWPAVVKRMYTKRKRISIMFVDSPDNPPIVIPTKKAISFKSITGTSLLEQNIEPPSLMETFKQAVRKVEEYYFKCADQRSTMSPMKYFKCPIDNPAEITDEDSQGTEKLIDDTGSDENSDENSDDDESQQLAISDAKSPDNLNEKVDPKKQEETAAILNLLKSSECKEYLLKLIKGEEVCKRHEAFLSKTASARRQLLLTSGANYVDVYEDPQFSEINDSFYELLVENVTNKSIQLRTYLYDVIIPQATVWSLTQLHKITLAEAEIKFSCFA